MKQEQETDSFKHWLVVYGPILLLMLGGFWLASHYIKPAPPHSITLAAGEPGGAYAEFARKYQLLLQNEGIEVKIIETLGSVENLQLIKAGKVDMAFLQGGVASAADQQQDKIEGLGSLYYEPLWLFHRASLDADRIPDLRGARVSVGQQGSGTNALVMRLIKDNHLDAGAMKLLNLSGREAAEQLENNTLDAAFFVSSPQSTLIRRLLHNPQIKLASFERAGAYARRYDFLTTLILPEGAEDLGKNIPDRTIQMLATTSSLVIDPELHPALVSLMMQVLSKVHGGGGWFAEKGEFPSAKYMEFPLNSQAQRFYKYGPPFLQRYLPFWAASFLDRMKIMILPLLGLMLPLFKIVPPLYRWRMRARIYRWYEELEEVDKFIVHDAEDALPLLQRLEALEKEVRDIKVPLSFFQQLYHLRLHIDFIRSRLQQPGKG